MHTGTFQSARFRRKSGVHMSGLSRVACIKNGRDLQWNCKTYPSCIWSTMNVLSPSSDIHEQLKERSVVFWVDRKGAVLVRTPSTTLMVCISCPSRTCDAHASKLLSGSFWTKSGKVQFAPKTPAGKEEDSCISSPWSVLSITVHQ